MKNRTKATNNRDVFTLKFKDVYSSRYYRLNKTMLSIFGQWPYQSALESKIRCCIPLFVSYSILVPQVRSMIITCRGFDRFAECFSPLLANIACQFKLIIFMFQKPLIKTLLDQMREDWKGVQHLPQENILIKHAKIARFYTELWVSGIYGCFLLWLILVMSPKILDIIDPLNHTRKVLELFPADYGIGQEKYYCLIQIHCWSSILFLILIVPAVDTLYICLAQHVCAMFHILRFNMHNIIQEDHSASVMLEPSLKEDIYYHQVKAAVMKHIILIDYINDIASSNQWPLFFVILVQMIGLSITAYQAVAEDIESESRLKYTMFSLCLVLHLFVITLPGHWIMTSSSAFRNYAYGTKWYMMSLRTRKLILLVIRASLKPRTITAGKIYIVSFEKFSKVVRISISFLTVLTSLQ